jgi:hypothetical protein
MPDTRTYHINRVLQSSESDHSRTESTGQELSRPSAASGPHSARKYEAVSPKGVHLAIPEELFIALSDFIKTRKCPGSITIQFRSGEILGMESVAKKTYRK